MIEVKTEKGQIELMKLSGSTPEIAADVLIVVRAIYNALKEQDEKLAGMFEFGVRRMIAENESVFEPWEDDDED